MASLLLALALAQTAALSERHRIWLQEEVHFLISTREREAFLGLEGEEARERFIEAFWRRRDPTPGTARNEARERHLRRLEEADRHFTVLASRPGRFTERGRVYQLLGPPRSRDDFTHAGNRLYPLELWHYAGVTETFLPESFYLIFFREGGFGDYRLWSPTADGPPALIRSHEPARFYLRPELAFDELQRVDYELSMAVERLVPGESGDLPAFASESLLTNLEKYADVAERYRILEERVTARSGFESLAPSAMAVAFHDATGVPQVHYALEVPSDRAQWEAAPGGAGFQSSFTLVGRILDSDGREIDRIEDVLDVESRAPEDEPLSFQGRLVLPPGFYRIEWTIACVPGGSIGTASTLVEVPEELGASELVLARSRTEIPGGDLLDLRPFQLGKLLLSPSPDGVFPDREAFAYLQLPGAREETTLRWKLSRDDQVAWVGESRVGPNPGKLLAIEQTIPLRDLPEGAYQLTVELGASKRETEIRVAPGAVLPSVRVLAREGLPAGHGHLRFRRGVLLARQGKIEAAIHEMSEAAGLLPRDLEVHLKLAYLLSATGQHERVIEILEPLALHHPENTDLLVLLGFASLAAGRFEEAASYYERALDRRPEDERLRSALAEARQKSVKH